jgi:mandelate racemase
MPSVGATIKAIRARAVVVPLKRPMRTAVGPIPSAPLVLIDVETSEQINGSAGRF